jgi:phosphatidylglycerol:prolipoprotein diacylglycerol transferase
MRRRKRFQGRLLGCYLLFYSVARFIIEFYRGDPRGWFIEGVFSTAQGIGIVTALLALYLLLGKKSSLESTRKG